MTSRTVLQSGAGGWDLREAVGLGHAPQVIAVPAPGLQGTVALAGAAGAIQAARGESGIGFLHLRHGLPAFAALRLERTAIAAGGPVTCRMDAGGWELGNGRCAVRFVADAAPGGGAGLHPGPVAGMRVGDGPWRGRTWLDTRSATCRWSCTLVEPGPLRAVWRGRAELDGGRWYELEATLDADQDHVRIVERAAGGRGDQAVWDFAGVDLPRDWLQTDPGPNHRRHRLHWGIARRLARLAPWTQFSQINDFADGFAVAIGADAIGAVALEGGAWRGRRLDHLEGWVRRFAEPAARREPPDATADLVHPDHIAARGGAVEAAHLCWEGWIGPGIERRWALVLAPAAALEPPGGPGAERGLGHFEDRPDPEAWRAQQGLLRRIHVQHGLAPLQEQLGWTLELAEASASAPLWPHPLLREHHECRAVMPPRGDAQVLDDYLAARVLGFWQCSGAAFSNVVVGRRIAPQMLHLERLVADGAADPARRALWRARLLFLAHLFASDHFYPGDASMRPLGDPEGMEPTFQGMANQNFLTDAFCVHGMAAEVFPAHPRAGAWRARAAALWSRQLDVHVHADGVWEESHTYFQHVLNTVLPWLLRRGEGLSDPRLHRLLAAGLRQLAPCDAGLGGRAALVPFGDHAPDPACYAGIWAAYATAIAPHAPELAAHLAWMAQAMGAVPTAPRPAAVDPRLGDEHLAGLGVMLRAPGADGKPTLLALRCGGAWGHHHADDASLMLWGAGRLLIGDAGRSHVAAPDAQRKFRADGHSRWVPDGLPPRNHLYRFTRGLCTARDLAAPMPWALAWSPVVLVDDGTPDGRVLPHPLRHHRLVARLAAGLWLVSDAWDAGLAATIRWHLAGEARCAGEAACLDLGGDGALTLHAAGCRPEAVRRDCGRDHPEALTTEVACASAAGRCLTFVALGPPLAVRGREVVFAGRNWLIDASPESIAVAGGGTTVVLPRLAPDPA